MSLFINPDHRGPNEPTVTGKVQRGDHVSRSEETAAKVDSIVSLPEVRSSRQTQILKSAGELAAKIQRIWDEREPAELAEQIVALENRVALLEGNSPEIEKVRSLAKNLHFLFVFPLALDLDEKFEGSGPYSFARAIHAIADAILNAQDLSLARQLNATQFSETMRYATGRGA